MQRPTAVESVLAGATEVCEHCGQRYAYELERHCVDCDAPGCPFCVVIVRGSVRCPHCVEEDD